MQGLSRVVYRNLTRAKTYDLLSRVLFKAEREHTVKETEGALVWIWLFVAAFA